MRIWSGRLGRFAVVVVVLLGLKLFLQPRREVDLEATLGVTAARSLDLYFTDDKLDLADHLHLALPDPAPARVRHRLKLAAGEYVVSARLGWPGGERSVSRRLSVVESGTYSLDLRDQ